MNKQAIVDELAAVYPGKLIKLLPEENPSEIVCEFDPADAHPEWSLATAVIDRSAPHFHRWTTAVYHVIKGSLKLCVDQDEFEMYEGQQFTITPGKVHWASGDACWVEVYCTPGHSPADHILVDQ